MNRITMKKGSDRIVIFDKTTGLGAKNLNRNYIMMEQDPKYYEIACKRVQG